jgi:predicted PurR-regulated permease PerM
MGGDFSPTQVRGIGLLEFLAAIGLIVPAATKIAPILTPIAAAGLGLIMVGAMVTHFRRHEHPEIITNIALGLLAVFVAAGQFWITPRPLPSARDLIRKFGWG